MWLACESTTFVLASLLLYYDMHFPTSEALC